MLGEPVLGEGEYGGGVAGRLSGRAHQKAAAGDGLKVGGSPMGEGALGGE